jgi:hypothetical protein
VRSVGWGGCGSVRCGACGGSVGCWISDALWFGARFVACVVGWFGAVGGGGSVAVPVAASSAWWGWSGWVWCSGPWVPGVSLVVAVFVGLWGALGAPSLVAPAR